MIRKSFLSASVFALGVVAAPSFEPVAQGDVIAIKDCSGQVRSHVEVDEGSSSSLNIAVSSSAGSNKVFSSATLSSESGEVLSSDVALGTVVFEPVFPGEWKACFSDPALRINRVSVVALPSSSSEASKKAASVTDDDSSAGLLAAGGIGIGGAALGLVSLTGDSGSGGVSTVQVASTDGLSSQSTMQGGGATTGASSATGHGGRGGISTSNTSSGPCFIGDDDEVEVLSPFR